jgi:hypothetical protein
MSFHLAKFETTWSDEFEVYGFKVFTDLELKRIESLREDDTEVTWYFGTNEGWDSTPVSEFVNELEISEISERDYMFLMLEFNGQFGNFPDFDDLIANADF